MVSWAKTVPEVLFSPVLALVLKLGPNPGSVVQTGSK
jgi:hypothetical protein